MKYLRLVYVVSILLFVNSLALANSEPSLIIAYGDNDGDRDTSREMVASYQTVSKHLFQHMIFLTSLRILLSLC